MAPRYTRRGGDLTPTCTPWPARPAAARIARRPSTVPTGPRRLRLVPPLWPPVMPGHRRTPVDRYPDARLPGPLAGRRRAPPPLPAQHPIRRGGGVAAPPGCGRVRLRWPSPARPATPPRASRGPLRGATGRRRAAARAVRTIRLGARPACDSPDPGDGPPTAVTGRSAARPRRTAGLPAPLHRAYRSDARPFFAAAASRRLPTRPAAAGAPRRPRLGGGPVRLPPRPPGGRGGRRAHPGGPALRAGRSAGRGRARLRGHLARRGAGTSGTPGQRTTTVIGYVVPFCGIRTSTVPGRTNRTSTTPAS